MIVQKLKMQLKLSLFQLQKVLKKQVAFFKNNINFFVITLQ